MTYKPILFHFAEQRHSHLHLGLHPHRPPVDGRQHNLPPGLLPDERLEFIEFNFYLHRLKAYNLSSDIYPDNRLSAHLQSWKCY